MREQQERSKKRKKCIELNVNAEEDTLCPVVVLRCDDADSGSGYTTLELSREKSAESHGKASYENCHALIDSEVNHGAAENAHLKKSEEPGNNTVKTLCTGNNLKNKALGEMLGSACHKTGSRLIGRTGTLSRTNA